MTSYEAMKLVEVGGQQIKRACQKAKYGQCFLAVLQVCTPAECTPC